MKTRISVVCIIIIAVLGLGGCSKKGSGSLFRIQYIDVGQGDAALVECDGHYMLIDGGDTTAGDKVYSVLEENGIQKLDILAISHMHKDHIGGLEKALRYASSIGITISNSNDSDTEVFKDFVHQLSINGASITVPNVGDKYSLGSAEVEVVDVASSDPNDSLVLLVTYGKTNFLFTGDIEYDGQKRLADKYQNDADKEFKVNVMKMPHHGSSDGDLYRFVRTFMPDYAVISCGAGNMYGHPHEETLNLLDQADIKKIFRTDINGDITVRSDGKEVTFKTQK